MTSPLGCASGKRRVSIGLPVYNGENFLAAAINSILAQDFQDFELIIGDNASTDATPEICRRYAERDARVRVVRHPRNIGAANNYNYVFQCSSGEFFKWAAHDDVMGPRFLSTCLDGLERHADAVLVYPEFDFADKDLTPMQVESPFVHTTAADPVTRLRETLAGLGFVTSVFGLFRRSALLQTRLIGGFDSSDHVLLTECALLGHIVRLPGNVQFIRRLHDKTSRQGKTAEELAQWFDPEAFMKPVQKPNREYLWSITRMPGLTLSQRARAAALVLSRVAKEKAAKAGWHAGRVPQRQMAWRRFDDGGSSRPPHVELSEERKDIS